MTDMTDKSNKEFVFKKHIGLSGNLGAQASSVIFWRYLLGDFFHGFRLGKESNGIKLGESPLVSGSEMKPTATGSR